MAVTVHILLFRGVGGDTKLPTGPLRAALADAGFENVTTYIASGNAVLRSRLGAAKVVTSVAAICEKEFAFTKAIYAIPLDDWEKQVIAANPFPDKTEKGNVFHAAWLESIPSPERIAALKALAVDGDQFEVVGNVAYIYTPAGVSNSRLGARFDKGIGVPNTARNWNTVLKMRELARAAL